jgi:uncharacterized membrane protein
LFVTVITALPALADSSLPDPHHRHTHVLGASGSAGTAFTGVNVTPFVIAFAVLMIVGLSALALQRRRSVQA